MSDIAQDWNAYKAKISRRTYWLTLFATIIFAIYEVGESWSKFTDNLAASLIGTIFILFLCNTAAVLMSFFVENRSMRWFYDSWKQRQG